MEHLIGYSLGLALALPANTRLGWICLPVANTQKYIKHYDIQHKDNSLKTFSVITFCITTFSIMTFSITAFSIMTFSITINKT